MIRSQVQPRDVPPVKAARRLHLTLAEFERLLPRLLKRGFPPPDPDTGNFDLKAIDAWMDARSGLVVTSRPAKNVHVEAIRSAATPLGPGAELEGRIPYTSVRNGNRFFEPRGRMVAAGFPPRSLGPDDERARKEAWRLYNEWRAVRGGKSTAPTGPAETCTEQVSASRAYATPGSIGAAWQEWVRTEQWKKLALSNRTRVWWPNWMKRIEPTFGSMDPNRVTLAMMSTWREEIEVQHGRDSAHKALKIWRAFWGLMQALRYTQLTDPSKKVTNTAPRPRTERYTQVEALRLAKTAWRAGYRGLACIIILCWDAGFQPVDARTARARHLKVDPLNGRHVIDRSRDGRVKTQVAVIGTLSRLGDAMVRRYIADLGIEMHGEAFLFRTRTGVPYRELAVSRDFFDIRAMVDPKDKRQLRDMRRSATTEAFRGGADSKDVSQKFGNSIDRSAFLFKTYNPVDLEQVRKVDAARARSRRLTRRPLLESHRGQLLT